MGDAWCTIESDPGVFTELMETFGVTDVQMEELYDLEAESLNALRPVYGLIFLFKYVGSGMELGDPEGAGPDDGIGVFFAQQIINNACATQAILNILLNRPELQLGSELGDFREFVSEFPPDMKGEAIGNSERIRAAHNSFAVPDPFVSDERAATKDDEVYHFISYVPVNGAVYELDGLKAAPVRLGEATEDGWLDVARQRIQQRMQQYSEGEIRFNLMALIRDRRAVATEQLAATARAEQLQCCRRPGRLARGLKPDEQTQLAKIVNEQHRLREELERENEKRQRWTDENIRRRHNYIPFLFEMLRALGEKGQLQPLIDKARKPL